MSKFSERLKEARQFKGYSQKFMAQLLKITESGYAHWEQGRTEPNTETLRRICQILDVKSDYLIGLEDEDGSHNLDSLYYSDGTHTIKHLKRK